jgi:hypothetical protein
MIKKNKLMFITADENCTYGIKSELKFSILLKDLSKNEKLLNNSKLLNIMLSK